MSEVESIIQPQIVCQRAFDLMRDKQYDDAERLLSNCMGKSEDPIAVGLYHSAFGVLEKMRGEYKSALKHYERAEKLLPDDPILKLITARLLIEQEKEYSKAMRKCRQVVKLAEGNPVIIHHAKTLEGLAYGEKDNERKALACLEASIIGDFEKFITARNVDFHLVELCVGKRWGLDTCRTFVEKAVAFAEKMEEGDLVEKLQKILEAMA